jgi:hypothetical protein
MTPETMTRNIVFICTASVVVALTYIWSIIP